MTVVEEVAFPDPVAELVREVAAEARRLVSADTVYKIQSSSELRAAIQSKGIGKKSKGVYLRIRPTAGGAIVTRGYLPKHGQKKRELTSSSISEIIADMGVWVSEAKKKASPVGKRATGESNPGRF